MDVSVVAAVEVVCHAVVFAEVLRTFHCCQQFCEEVTCHTSVVFVDPILVDLDVVITFTHVITEVNVAAFDGYYSA